MIGVIIATITALILSTILVIVDNKLNKKKKHDFLKYLPGYNCGACGYGSCKGMADAMEQDVELYKKCKPLRGKTKEVLEEYIEKELV